MLMLPLWLRMSMPHGPALGSPTAELAQDVVAALVLVIEAGGTVATSLDKVTMEASCSAFILMQRERCGVREKRGGAEAAQRDGSSSRQQRNMVHDTVQLTLRMRINLSIVSFNAQASSTGRAAPFSKSCEYQHLDPMGQPPILTS